MLPLLDSFTAGLNSIGSEILKNTLFGFDLSNEPRAGNLSVATMSKWRPQLEEKYKTIDKLNEAWGTHYAGFNAIVFSADLERAIDTNRAMLYDWTQYQQARFKEYFEWYKTSLSDRMDLDFYTHIKSQEMNEYWLENGFTLRSRIDHESLYENMDILGCDLNAAPLVNDPDYNMQWALQMFAYDYFKSFAPDKPIYDSEWHSVDSTQFRGNIPRGYMRQVMRQAALHGMGGNALWHFVRPNSDMWAWKMETPFAQPYVIEDYFAESAVIESEMDRILPFSTAKKQVHILHSNTSHVRQGKTYFDAIKSLYEALFFEDLHVGFVTEAQLADPAFLADHDVKMLVIPNSEYITDEAYDGMKSLAANGAAIIKVGNALQYNQDAKPLSGNISGNVKHVPLSTKNDAREQVYEYRAEGLVDLGGVVKRYRVEQADGTPAKYIEARFTQKEGATLGYAMNLSNEEQTLRIIGPSAQTIGFKEFKYGAFRGEASEFTLKPREFISFNISR
jgi:hypothetical protein